MDIKTMLAAAVLLPLAGTAHAQDGQSAMETLRIAGAASPACVVRGATANAANNATFAPNGAAGGTITITQLVDLATAAPMASDIALDLPVVCNSAHRLIVLSQSGGLLRQGGQASNALRPNGFADFLPYRLEVAWGGLTLANASNGQAPFAIDEGAMVGDLRLRVSTPAGGGALTAGRYDDTITIRFEPAS